MLFWSLFILYLDIFHDNWALHDTDASQMLLLGCHLHLVPGGDVGSPHIELAPSWLCRAWSEELGQPRPWSFDDDKRDDDTIDNIKAKEIAKQKVEDNTYRLFHDVENDDNEISRAKKNLVDDEKNAGLRKSKKVALVYSKVDRGSTTFTSKLKADEIHEIFDRIKLSWI